MFQVVEAGQLTTVQDRGRFGYQRYGVSVSGAMDQFAFRIANILVGNNEYEAGLEVTVLGPKLKVLDDSIIAITGADLSPTLGEKPIPMWQAIKVPRDGMIAFGRPQSGCRAYLAIRGGIKNIPEVLGSKSTYSRKGALGENEIRPLQNNNVIEKGTTTGKYRSRKLPNKFIPQYLDEILLRVTMGPQDDYFSRDGIETFLSSGYQVTINADRMGYRLQGPRIKHAKGAEIISDATPLGAVQVPGNGMPIVLMSDRQTTGGYPKIATVITVDTYKLAQTRPDHRVKFSAVSVEEAVSELKELENKIQSIKAIMQ